MTETGTGTRWLSKDEQGVWRAYLVATACIHGLVPRIRTVQLQAGRATAAL